jgi:hypothetical protein
MLGIQRVGRCDLSGCSTPKCAWHKHDADGPTLATDEKACWQRQPPWFVIRWKGNPIRRTGFKDGMEARGRRKNRDDN